MTQNREFLDRCITELEDGARINVFGWDEEDLEYLMRHFENRYSIIANREGVWFKKWVKVDRPIVPVAPPVREQLKENPIRTLLALLIYSRYNIHKAKIFNNLLHLNNNGRN